MLLKIANLTKKFNNLKVIDDLNLNIDKNEIVAIIGPSRGFNYDWDLLLMYEPFKSLDYNLRIEMLNSLINLWNKSKKSILFITNEIDEAITLANRIIALQKRPTKVAKEIILDKESIGSRDMNSDEFIQYRKEIINILS